MNIRKTIFKKVYTSCLNFINDELGRRNNINNNNNNKVTWYCMINQERKQL